jgi:hypothetical protein
VNRKLHQFQIQEIVVNIHEVAPGCRACIDNKTIAVSKCHTQYGSSGEISGLRQMTKMLYNKDIRRLSNRVSREDL